LTITPPSPEQRAQQVDIPGLLQSPEVHIHQGPGGGVGTGVVDQHVNRSKSGDRLVHRHRRILLGVGSRYERKYPISVDTGIDHLLSGGFDIVGFSGGDRDSGRTALCEFEGRCQPDTPACTCDHDDFACNRDFH
jgi:hypothetical protein